MPQNTTIPQTCVKTTRKTDTRSTGAAKTVATSVMDRASTQNLSPERSETQDLSGLLSGPVLHSCAEISRDLFLNTTTGKVSLEQVPDITGPILLVYCEDKSYEAAIEKLYRAFAPRTPEIIGLHLGGCWPLYLHDQISDYEKCIASLVNKTIEHVTADCVILAQESMAGAIRLIESSCPTYVLQSET